MEHRLRRQWLLPFGQSGKRPGARFEWRVRHRGAGERKCHAGVADRGGALANIWPPMSADKNLRRLQEMNVLVLNAGSSSLKFQVISTDPDRISQDADERLCRGEMEGIGGEAIVTVETGKGPRQKFSASIKDFAAGLDYLLRWLVSEQSGIKEIRNLSDIQAVG